jgi:hypothetical protein
MTKEEREKISDILIERMLEENSIAWSDLSIDLKTDLYIRFYLNKYSDEKLIAELLGVDDDK